MGTSATEGTRPKPRGRVFSNGFITVVPAHGAQGAADLLGFGGLQKPSAYRGGGQRLQDTAAQAAARARGRRPAGEERLLPRLGPGPRGTPLVRELRTAQFPEHVGHGGRHGRGVQQQAAARVQGVHGVGVGAVGQAPPGHLDGLLPRPPSGLRGVCGTGLEEDAPGGGPQGFEAHAAGLVVIQALDTGVRRVQLAAQAVRPGQRQRRGTPQRMVGAAHQAQGVPQPGDALVQVAGAQSGGCDLGDDHEAVAGADAARVAEPAVVVGFEEVEGGLPQLQALEEAVVVEVAHGTHPAAEALLRELVGLCVEGQFGDLPTDLGQRHPGPGAFRDGFEASGALSPQDPEASPGRLHVGLQCEPVHVLGRHSRERALQHADLFDEHRLVLAAHRLVHPEHGDLGLHHHAVPVVEVRAGGQPGEVVHGQVVVVLAAALLGQLGAEPRVVDVELVAYGAAARVGRSRRVEAGEGLLHLRGVPEMLEPEHAVQGEDVGLPARVGGPVFLCREHEFLLASAVHERLGEAEHRQDAEHLSGPHARTHAAAGQCRPVRVEPVVGLGRRRAAQPVQDQGGEPAQILSGDHTPVRGLLDLPQHRTQVVRCPLHASTSQPP